MTSFCFVALDETSGKSNNTSVRVSFSDATFSRSRLNWLTCAQNYDTCVSSLKNGITIAHGFTGKRKGQLTFSNLPFFNCLDTNPINKVCLLKVLEKLTLMTPLYSSSSIKHILGTLLS